MNVGIIILSTAAETCRIALQHATFHLKQNDEVKIFFVDSGREYFHANSEQTKFKM